MPYLGRLRCPRCRAQYAESEAYGGCEACDREGVAVNLVPDFHIAAGEVVPDNRQRGLFRYRRVLPIPAHADPVSLDEGNTPLLPLARLGRELHLSNLWLKDESRNPTWSYKDRLAAVAVTRAAADGASTVVVATTGNHGAAVAAYAAVAGIRCVVLTLTTVPITMLTLMQAYGAIVVACSSAPDRWIVMADAVREHGWVPMSGFRNPPVGSNPYGTDGYKTIAYELWQDLQRVPDVVIVPTAYADALAGIARGFIDLREAGATSSQPRLVAVDPFGAYAYALADGTDQPRAVVSGASSAAFSVATPIGTYQGLAALRATKGTAVGPVRDDEVITMQLRLAACEGLFAEASSVLPLVAASRLAGSGWIGQDELVACVSTSTGLKDVQTTAKCLPTPQVIEPTLASLDRALAQGGVA